MDAANRRPWLRIAVSALGLIVCALLIAMWVSSYYKNSEARIYLGKQSDPHLWYAQIYSFNGEISTEIRVRSGGGAFPPAHKFQISFLWPVLLSVLIAGLPWVRWFTRFSVRSLLIVVSLIALFLGIIMSR